MPEEQCYDLLDDMDFYYNKVKCKKIERMLPELSKMVIAESIHLSQKKNNDAAVIYVGEDLDVILALCDKIAVLCAGKITGIVDARTTTKEEIGLLMTKNTENEENGN